MNPLNTRLLSRRTVLRAGAVSIGLPLLDAMLPLGARAEQKAEALRPRRLLLAARHLGTNEPYFFPKETGLKYEAPRYLKLIERHRGRFTVISGMSHLGYPNQHTTQPSLWTGISPERVNSSLTTNTVSLDQFVADRMGHATRIRCLLMGLTALPMSFNRQGVPVPCEAHPGATFAQLFLDGSADLISREMVRLERGQSILDDVRDELKSLGGKLGADDRSRLDRLAGSIRDAEQQFKREGAWIKKPKPKVDRKIGDYANPTWSSSQRMWFDLAALALQTDQTRVAVVIEPQGQAGNAPGTTIPHHEASHHGQDPQKVEQYARFEEEEVRNFGILLDKLNAVQEGSGTLLDHTVVLWASNLGNASAHSSSNLPILVAGGGFKHQGHVAFDRQRNKPLSNLYVRVLHQVGVAVDRFGCNTGVLSELG